MSLPATNERVTSNTDQGVNNRIRCLMEGRVLYYSRHPGEIDDRLAELDREWDIERAIEMNASILALSGTLLGLRDRRFLLLPLVVGGFLLQHALQGWCPPVPVLRRFGFRTRGEIEAERHALKALRGDFGPPPGVDRILGAV
ncbi:MAG: DUF2892 domain-containing protein [Acidobacteria bacterium]|nr:DUF2892 domain-containing protein [Acidobacteriota bacterium]